MPNSLGRGEGGPVPEWERGRGRGREERGRGGAAVDGGVAAAGVAGAWRRSARGRARTGAPLALHLHSTPSRRLCTHWQVIMPLHLSSTYRHHYTHECKILNLIEIDFICE